MAKLLHFTLSTGRTMSNEPNTIPMSRVTRVTPLSPNTPRYEDGSRTMVECGPKETFFVREEYDEINARLEGERMYTRDQLVDRMVLCAALTEDLPADDDVVHKRLLHGYGRDSGRIELYDFIASTADTICTLIERRYGSVHAMAMKVDDGVWAYEIAGAWVQAKLADTPEAELRAIEVYARNK